MLFLAERVNIMEFNETMKINLEFDKEKEVREIVAKVYEALKIKGYDPISLQTCLYMQRQTEDT